jgi:carboxyl-terminal processing protease
MVRYLFLSLLLASQLLFPDVSSGASGALEPEPYFSQIAVRFARRFPEEHLRQLPLDDAVSARAWQNYLDSLDPERVYFTAADIAKFATDKFNLDDQLDKGDLTFAYSVFGLFKQRVRDRAAYVGKLLDAGFDLDKNETYKWRRKNEPWPKDQVEWNEIWRQRVKNDYVRRIVAKELVNKAKEKGKKAPDQSKSPSGESNPTNVVPSATNEVNSAGADNKGADDDEPDQAAQLSPEDGIRKQNKQFLTMLEDTDSAWVLEKYLSAFAHAYDPHSEYMSTGSAQDFNIGMKLSLGGIGAVLGADEEGTAKVIKLIANSPAALDKRDVRLRRGDRIIAVGEGDEPPVDIHHWPLRKMVDRIRGEKGSKVVLIVIPASDPAGLTTKRVDLIRADVKLEDQAASWKMYEVKGGDGVVHRLGVITLPSFYANMKQGFIGQDEAVSCCSDVENILERMKTGTNKVEGVLLNLRNNGGGSLAEVVKMAGLFVGDGPIVQVKEGNSSRKVLNSIDSRVVYGGPLVVLVNRFSASASEILAGALQDYGRAMIVGDSRTHGKGTVQSIIDLGRDQKYGEVRVTTAMYYRISGSSTQLKGVAPDIVVPSAYDCMVDIGEESLTNPMEWGRIQAAQYSPNLSMPYIVSALTAKSEKRRTDDPRFARYGKFLEQIKSLTRTQEIPLGLAARRKMAETESNLNELENEIAAEDEGDKKENQVLNNDLVLSESLQILIDYIQKAPKMPEPVPVPQEKKGVLELMKDYWQGN